MSVVNTGNCLQPPRTMRTNSKAISVIKLPIHNALSRSDNFINASYADSLRFPDIMAAMLSLYRCNPVGTCADWDRNSATRTESKACADWNGNSTTGTGSKARADWDRNSAARTECGGIRNYR